MNEPADDQRATVNYGGVVPPRALEEASKIENQVRDFLSASGYPVSPKGRVLCHHPDADKDVLALTPDIMIEDWRLAIEVDPCAPVSHHGTTHAGQQEVDRLRNDLLEAVGWSVLRLRIGAQEGDHIGDRDVVVQSESLTKAAREALTDALEDFKTSRKPRVRFVPKGASPKPAQRRSHVVNIGAYAYADAGYIFTWYPSLDSKEKVTLRLSLDGRFLYTHGHRVPRFIAEVGLHQVPREDWKDRLTEFLRDQEPQSIGTTKWPWGDTLFVTHSHPAAELFIEACEHEKHTIDREDFWFTVSGHHVQRWHPHALLTDAELPIVEIHPDAIALGYRLSEVTLDTGRYGPYQRIFVTRSPQQPDTPASEVVSDRL